MRGGLRATHPILVPLAVAEILSSLENKGFQSYVVGGCVRDSLLGQAPHDWDIGTAATPEQVMDCFSGERILPTGLIHGTVTLVRQGIPYEITTFRVDGNYSDGRHPDQVSFVSDVHEDLARRDFTVNAMAYAPKCGLVDCFDGQIDLQNRKIRAVGEPAARFGEDALRILRALRFAAVYGFSIEENTAEAARKLKNTLNYVAVERIFTEFSKLLCGMGAKKILTEYPDIIGIFIPEIIASVGFKQNHPRHIYDIWRHTATAIGAAPPNLVVRLALFFHDLTKPTGTADKSFAFHCEEGALTAKMTLKRLHCDVNTTRMVELLVKYHGTRLCPVYPGKFHERFQSWLALWKTVGEQAFEEMPHQILEPGLRQARRWLGKLGEERLRLLIEVQRADIRAQDPYHAKERLEQLEDFDGFLQIARATNQCYSLGNLAVDGKTLMTIGYMPGPELGRTLDTLLEDVVEGRLPNQRSALLNRAGELFVPSSSDDSNDNNSPF